jgi:hypothetical protein
MSWNPKRKGGKEGLINMWRQEPDMKKTKTQTWKVLKRTDFDRTTWWDIVADLTGS